MGYNTKYELEIIEGDRTLISKLRNENKNAEFAIDENGECNESCKWYEYRNEMIKFSEKNKGTLLKLIGKGEEAGDIWAEYYRDGKHQVCMAEIVIPDFNEDLMK